MVDSLLSLIFIIGAVIAVGFIAGGIQNVRQHIAKDKEN